MTNFDEYLRQGEPNKAEKAKVWKTAIGLQQVDGLTPSKYLIETAKQNIEGDITIEEVRQRIDSYYKQQPNETDTERTEEAETHSSASLPLSFLENLLFGEKHILKNREMHVHYEEIVQNESSEKKVVRKGGQKRWSEILYLIKENPKITRKELSEKIGINPSAIQKHITKLKTEGFIERVGADRGGYWKILEE